LQNDAFKCLEMEAKFIGLCERDKIKLTDTETALSHKIKQRAQDIIDGACEYSGAYAAAAALVVFSCPLSLYQSLFHLPSTVHIKSVGFN
jgi:hypothetical protein